MSNDFRLEEAEDAYQDAVLDKTAEIAARLVQTGTPRAEAIAEAKRIIESQASDLESHMTHVADGETVHFLSAQSAEPALSESARDAIQLRKIASEIRELL